MLDPEFEPGTVHTAALTVTNRTKWYWEYEVELFLAGASLGSQWITLDAYDSDSLSWSVTMPAIEGTYPVYAMAKCTTTGKSLGRFDFESITVAPAAGYLSGWVLERTYHTWGDDIIGALAEIPELGLSATNTETGFTIWNIPPGDYTLKVSAPGYCVYFTDGVRELGKKVSITPITIEAGKATTVTVGLTKYQAYMDYPPPDPSNLDWHIGWRKIIGGIVCEYCGMGVWAPVVCGERHECEYLLCSILGPDYRGGRIVYDEAWGYYVCRHT